MQTAAPPLPTPKRSKRRWFFVGGFALLLLATPIVFLAVADQWREYELEQIYREMDAEDPNWRSADLVAEMPALPDEQNAIVQIRRVDTLLKKSAFVIAPPWHTPANEEMRRVHNARLSVANAAMLRAAFMPLDPNVLVEVRKLKDFPSGQIKIDPALNFYFELTLDDLERVRNSMTLLDSDIMLRTHDNDLEGAAESLHALLNSSHAIGDHPNLISQMVRAGRQGVAVAALERLLGQGELAETDLAKIHALLERETNHNLLYHGLRGERAGSHQTYFALRDGTLSMNKMLRDMGGGANAAAIFWEHPDAFFPGSLSKGYPEHMRLFNEYVKAAKLKDEERLAAMQKIDQKVLANRGSFMTWMFMPATKKVAELHHRTQSQLRCAMAAVAVERYRAKYEAWPRGFDDLLKERLLDAIPNDPYDGKPLRLKLAPTGVLLYSVGLDKIDNQGKLDRSTPNAPGTDVGFELWDRQLRAVQPPVEKEK